MNTSPKFLKFALIALASIILAACGGGGGGSDPVINSAPTFGDSSVSIEVAENTTAVIYTAQASDANGNSITYSLSGGADQGKFNIGASSGEVRFVNAPDYDAPDDSGADRTYEVQISASDSLASSSMSLSVSITNVVEDGESSNSAPTAKISVIPEPASTTLTTATEITLNGSDSSDPDGDALEYTWSQPTGQGIELSSLSNASTSFTAAEAGTYTFTLTVDDGEFDDSADIEIEVQEPEVFPTNLFGFGQVLVNSSAERSFEFSNDGDSSNSYSLSFSSEVSSAFSADQPSFSLEAGESTLVTITFAPVGITEVTTYEGTVSILDSLNETAGGYDLRGAAVLAYDDTGIYQEQLVWDGQNSGFGGGVDGLSNSYFVALSPDGEQVFVTDSDDNALSVFDRDVTSGALSYRTMYQDGVDGVDGLIGARGIATSADGSQLFVTGVLDETLVVFDRDASGGLDLRIVFKDGIDGVNGLSGAHGVVLSPDDSQVFVTGAGDDALVVFDRDGNGEISYRTTFKNGTNGVNGLYNALYLTVSLDGRQVFVTGWLDNSLTVFDRDITNGEISYRQTFFDGVDGVDGLYYASGVQTSNDGSQIFVAGQDDGAIAVFARDTENGGTISYQRMYKNGIDGISGLHGPTSISLSPDDSKLFVSNWDNGLVVFDRDISTGELNYATHFYNDFFGFGDGIKNSGGWDISISPDGSQLFVNDTGADALSVFHLP